MNDHTVAVQEANRNQAKGNEPTETRATTVNFQTIFPSKRSCCNKLECHELYGFFNRKNST